MKNRTLLTVLEYSVYALIALYTADRIKKRIRDTFSLRRNPSDDNRKSSIGVITPDDVAIIKKQSKASRMSLSDIKSMLIASFTGAKNG